MTILSRALFVLIGTLAVSRPSSLAGQAAEADVSRLVAAMLGDTPRLRGLEADQQQLRLNAAIIAAMTLRFTEMPVTWRRQSPADVERLVATTDLKQQMQQMGMWEDWQSGARKPKRP